jgi:triosephosphate isomerase (TIM)
VTRKPYIAGNWKMNLDRKGCVALAGELRAALSTVRDLDVAVFPPFVYLPAVVEALRGSAIAVGGQDVCDRPVGAFTGEVSAAMLRDVGATIALVGHSERRHVYGESDELVQAKVQAALAGGLEVILCVGEKLEEREAGLTEQVNARQVERGLQGVPSTDLARVTLAYEPVWAIGTGRTATPAQVALVHGYLRGVVSGLYDQSHAQALRIQYGGSVKTENAAALMGSPDVDGALVGGASLETKSFLGIVRYR